jgi:hypothetical protein
MRITETAVVTSLPLVFGRTVPVRGFPVFIPCRRHVSLLSKDLNILRY